MFVQFIDGGGGARGLIRTLSRRQAAGSHGGTLEIVFGTLPIAFL